MSDLEAFARDTYRIVLGRNAADDEAAAVVRAIEAGAVAPLDFIRSVLESPEATARRRPPAEAALQTDMTGDGTFGEFLERVRPFTMTGIANLYATYDACRHLVRSGVHGDVVECGVWRGGMSMMMALALLEFEGPRRTIWCYDTFAGMTRPGVNDLRHDGTSATELWVGAEDGTGSDWWPASVDDVRANLLSTGYPEHLLRFVVGPVETTLTVDDPDAMPDRIAFLRLDTDWYESTLLELQLLYPRVTSGGITVVDDYGWWTGSRRAVEEYFGDDKPRPFLARIDPAGSRLMITP